ncbi:TonB-dependent receptor domain-containing protein, partial [Flavobacterium sp.]|uniref:TonB-dependent receptor plug domain-containing protein n=1 Tax=Flavobacterium sp. TaxID=239 RepID=UPI0028BE0B20
GTYFKIMMDNIPIVSDNSMGNNVDLTQINLDDIERIEIIEGSMGVTHGANAVSGILNIITKKNAKHKWEIAASVQEETVGEEYAVFNEGRHIQSLKISNQITDNWFASIGLNRNDFRGYLDNRKGKDYWETDMLRGYTWLPKQQYFGNALVGYSKGDFRIFYKFDYLNENIDYYDPSIKSEVIPPFTPKLYTSDTRFLSNRLYNNLNASGNLFSLKYNASVSYQKQTRNNEYFRYYQENQEETNLSEEIQQEADVIYSTGTLTNFFKNSKADLQIGYELTNTKGHALVDAENLTKVHIEKRLENYDFFVVSEIKLTDKFAVRPGLRASIQSLFDSQYATSLGLRQLFDKQWEVRGAIGQSFRTPTFEELYSRIQFSGHNFYGNENLIPETSTSYEVNLKKEFDINTNTELLSKAAAGFLDVDDRIEMALVGTSSNGPIYQYINISAYKMWNFSTNHQFRYKNFTANVGAILVGISQKIDDGEAVSDDKFLYNLQGNVNLAYEFKKANTLVSLYYKYNGKQQQFVSSSENGQAVYKLSEIEGYSFMDASVRKSFFNKQFDVTVGARNILNVTQINQGITSGAHATSSAILLGYGRSYFLKLAYNLNF